MTRLSIAPASADDARIGGFLDRQKRRVDAMPPGMCPLAQQLTLLEEGALQTCGKCVPCRDGLPQLAGMLRHLVDCQADAAEVERMRALAEMVRDTSDCAIGYESANALLEGLDAFAAEVESHVSKHECQRSVGQSVPCETFCPAHVNVPAYIALVAQGDYAGAVQMIRKDNPFPTACGLVCEHPCEQRCRRTLIDAPLNIRGIKEFACEHARADQVPVPKRLPATGRRVAVVGGGNVAMDAVRTARRLGAEATIVYRRSEKELPARAEEVHHAREEGIRFRMLTNPVEVLADERGWVRGLRCVEMELGEPDESGRRSPVVKPGSEFDLPCDVVVMALGTSPNPLIASTTEGLRTDRRGCIEADAQGATSRPGVFAGGDAVTGAATVILAMGAGRAAARAIDEYLRGKETARTE